MLITQIRISWRDEWHQEILKSQLRRSQYYALSSIVRQTHTEKILFFPLPHQRQFTSPKREYSQGRNERLRPLSILLKANTNSQPMAGVDCPSFGQNLIIFNVHGLQTPRTEMSTCSPAPSSYYHLGASFPPAIKI